MSKVKNAYKEIEGIVGQDFVTEKDFMKAAYSRGVDPAFPDQWADMIVRPETTEEVSDIVKIANKYKIKIYVKGNIFRFGKNTKKNWYIHIGIIK